MKHGMTKIAAAASCRCSALIRRCPLPCVTAAMTAGAFGWRCSTTPRYCRYRQ
jgi:hypothetical protein